MAPSLLTARNDSMNSVRLSIRISTRSPNCDAAAAQRAGQCGHPAVELTPRRGVAEEAQRRARRAASARAGRAGWSSSACVPGTAARSDPAIEEDGQRLVLPHVARDGLRGVDI